MKPFKMICLAVLLCFNSPFAFAQNEPEQPAKRPTTGGFRPITPRTTDEPFFIPSPEYGTKEWAVLHAASRLRYVKQYYPARHEIHDQFEFIAHFLDRDVTTIGLRDTPFHFKYRGQLEEHQQTIREIQAEFKQKSREDIDFAAAVEKLESVLSPAERSALWFCEIGVQSPYRYLMRNDVRKDLEISNEQLLELEQIRKRLVQEVPKEIRELKREAILKVFADLSDEQRKQFESLVGYRIATLAQYFDEVSREKFRLVLEMKLPVMPLFSQDGGRMPFQIIYTGKWIDPVLAPLIQSLGSEEPVREHDEEQQARFEKLFADARKLEELEPLILNGNFTEYWKAHFEWALKLVGPESTDEQSIGSKAGTNQMFKKVGPEFKEFTDSVLSKMIALQLVTCRDEVLCHIGPVRFLLTPCVAKEIGLQEKQADAIKDVAVEIYRQYQWDEREIYSRAFADTFEVLTRSQRKQIEERIGFTTKEMARMYPGNIIHKSKYKEQYWEGITPEQFVKEMQRVK